jgi:hypothetical protein
MDTKWTTIVPQLGPHIVQYGIKFVMDYNKCSNNNRNNTEWTIKKQVTMVGFSNPWQSKCTIKYYMKKNTTLSKQFSNPINQIVEGGKIIDTQYTTALFLHILEQLWHVHSGKSSHCDIFEVITRDRRISSLIDHDKNHIVWQYRWQGLSCFAIIESILYPD